MMISKNFLNSACKNQNRMKKTNWDYPSTNQVLNKKISMIMMQFSKRNANIISKT